MIRPAHALTASLPLLASSLGIVGLLAIGCGSQGDDGPASPAQVTGKGDLDSQSQAVSLANLKMVNGTYGAGCTGRSGGWSLPFAGYGGALDSPLLSVVTNDAACTLTVTSIKAGGVLFSAMPVIPMGTAFAAAASKFTPTSGVGEVTVSTYAGSGAQDRVDGPLASAAFFPPTALALDGSGNLYVIEQGPWGFRKVSSDGIVSTISINAAVNSVAVDAAGNLYLTDIDNHRILKRTPLGVVTTLAGNGTFGFADGTGSAAMFANPRGITVDASGNVYVADASNHRIRKVTQAGVVTTLAGSTSGFVDGVGPAARFNMPWGVALDASNHVYVTDFNNHSVRKVSPSGAVSTLAGNGTAGFAEGIGANARFNHPRHLTVDGSGNVYVADEVNNRIRKVTPSGATSTLAGDGTFGFVEGPGATAQFGLPYGVAIDADNNLFVADQNNHRIRKIATTSIGSGVSFYGNAKVDTSTFESNFTVSLRLSDDPNTASASAGSVYIEVSGSSQTELFAPSDYTFDTTPLTVEVGIDNTVIAVSGHLSLTPGSHTASAYVIDPGTLPAIPTFADYDAAFKAGPSEALVGLQIPATSLLALGTPLPTVRTIILQRWDEGVVAYQAIQLTFNAP